MNTYVLHGAFGNPGGRLPLEKETSSEHIDEKTRVKLEALDLIKKLECAVIFFESPLRILKTLNFINDHYGSCEMTLVRELTKKNEEVINSNITEVIEKLKNRKKILGEITFVVKPLCNSKENSISNEEISDCSNSCNFNVLWWCRRD